MTHPWWQQRAEGEKEVAATFVGLPHVQAKKGTSWQPDLKRFRPCYLISFVAGARRAWTDFYVQRSRCDWESSESLYKTRQRRKQTSMQVSSLQLEISVGQNRMYTRYKYTVHDRTFGDFPAKNTVCTLNIYTGLWPTLHYCA